MSINWRTAGDVPFETWKQVLSAANSPLASDLAGTYQAAQPHTLLALAMMAEESSYGTHFNRNTIANKNVLNLRPRGGLPGYQKFVSWSLGLAEWKARITDSEYAYAATKSVFDLVSIFAPPTDDNDPIAYTKHVEARMNAWPHAFTSPVDHPPEVIPVKDSTGVELNMTPNLIPEAGYADSLVLDHETSAYDFLGQRVIRGVTLHRMLGGLEGTDDYFHGGAPGLTDMGIDSSGTKMYRWNDATGAAHKDVSANRAPWASGPYRASAYGDGLKFVNKYGVNAVNRDRRSLEIDRFYGDAWTDESMREYAQTTAHDAHNYGITWEQFPISPRDGFSFVCWHNEFTGTDYKECPGSVVMAQTDEFIGMVKGIMKASQQTGVPIPPEPPKPIPVSPYPKGATEEWCRVVYGSVKVSWAAKPFVFDLKRPECRAWLAYCSSTIPAGGDYTDGHWGPLEKVIRRGNKGSNGRDYLYGNAFLYRQEPSNKQKG